MPVLNHKGPMGQGPMTGRRMGRCTNFGANLEKETPGESKKPVESTNEDTVFPGRNRGFGFGRCRGRGGCGMGRQNRFRGGEGV